MIRVICPVCWQRIMQGKTGVALAHCDQIGHTCPMSGQPITATWGRHE